MIINATIIRVGMILSLEGELYRVNWMMHRTPGKGDACIQTKLKHIISGKNLEKRFRSADRVEKADLETRDMQYLYTDGSGFVCMDQETYDQVSISTELIDQDMHGFLKEGDIYSITFYGEQPVGIQLPLTIDLKVVMAPPVVKKATVTTSLRPVELENGMTVNAPGFVKEGDTIRVRTEDKEYMERVT